ncbi:MAG: hypothetical protein A4E53_02470 [Pelotomaculum sp. PtaB.Bin104]|nr:MAG: hypothetical protein A4E53_02470 [Pelotomaculum sp. PtaB.Bin104]
MVNNVILSKKISVQELRKAIKGLSGEIELDVWKDEDQKCIWLGKPYRFDGERKSEFLIAIPYDNYMAANTDHDRLDRMQKLEKVAELAKKVDAYEDFQSPGWSIA